MEWGIAVAVERGVAAIPLHAQHVMDFSEIATAISCTSTRTPLLH